MSRVHFGNAGHFVGAPYCRFHLHTHVNGFCVSTVGEYVPRGKAMICEIGDGRFFETMVFKLDGAGEVTHFNELASAAYNDRQEANAGHETMLARFEVLP